MAKKQLIMEKALELFAENGVEATSVQQITESCGISKGAFYLSFKSKDQLIFGIIDHFISEIAADLEQAVNKGQMAEQLMFRFYHTIFHTYQKHSGFARILMKEPFTSCNMELVEQLRTYDQFMNNILFSLVERQFPQVKVEMRADLVFIIKGFIKHYAELFFISNYPVELEELCHSLVEKTIIIAEHAKIPYVTTEIISYTNIELLTPSKEQLSNMLTQKMNESIDSILRQSLELLSQDLADPQLPPAVIQGLLKNLREHSHCKWVASLYEMHLQN